MPPVYGQRTPFFPKADAAVLRSKHAPPSPTSRPTAVAPLLDVENARTPLDPWSKQVAEAVYPTKSDLWAPAPVPERPVTCDVDKYLFPMLTSNERLRLTVLFYYTHGVLEDTELMSRLQEKVHLARETAGWEYVIAGLIDHNTFTRMVTVGLPLAILPRRESTCAHTLNQPAGSIFNLANMTEDWRFRKSPHVDQGGLRAYAGAPLRFETESGEHVALGSLCVASNSPQEPLSKSQQQALARLADWIVSDIVHSARSRRQRQRRWMLELLSVVQQRSEQGANVEEVILEILRQVYPSTTVNIQRSYDGMIQFAGGPSLLASELEQGLWEDYEHFDFLIEHRNHEDLIADRVVRVIAAQCASQSTPTFLVVGSNDFRLVFDDVDSWFVNMCAANLCRFWQSHALKEALAAKENFLRGITHQLRTPIHGILGSVELLIEELNTRNLIGSTTASSPFMTPDTDKMDPYVYIKTIRTSARELISTVNSLIKLNRWADVAQTERLTGLYAISEIEKALLDETTQVLRDDVPVRASIVFTSLLPSNCDLLAIDLPLFVDCIQPLLINAFQNTSGGVVALTISISNDFQSLVVDVEDTGRGISLTNQRRIFGAYEKVDTNTTDAGLGLTLATKSASLMNGHVSLVSSEVGKGSHFRAVFAKPVTACSFPLLKPIKDNRLERPLVFHRITPSLETSLLGHHFSQHLTSLGYVQSENPDEPLLIIDYTSDLSKLHGQVLRVNSKQIAICLVPESECFINFDNKMVLIENRVIYVRGPFLSITLKDALAQANALFDDLASKEEENKSYFDVPNINFYPPTTGDNDANDETGPPAPSPSPRDSAFSPTVQLDLAQLLQKLHMAQLPLVSEEQPASTKPMTLLVDDNAVNLRLLEMYCSRRKIPYRTAADGQQAVDIFAAHNAVPPTIYDPLLQQDLVTKPRVEPFQLVLMDLQMPVCDGIDATRQIRALERKHGSEKSVMFIVTGQDSPSDRANAEEAGADGYLVKPVGPKALDRSVKQWFPHAEIK
ncbi:putative histidine kinase-like protein HHK3p [Dothidotthia symphoricarpi CBS 119687]|uniref:histidine kinase n=1 Tax=Dothidotthia symphoricarpi CBS 119687 TaxID=1392245 RepID=A0A6A6AF58_9PLEO|nr:putative histidine kinase-like protein HHK3p [Dothidotthia symphoricarpi CBS 119687]KAF2130186.1 putative histidine kinase-like protein HHK3p [Dothidotthia symphoricarpi CBS 119687]